MPSNCPVVTPSGIFYRNIFLYISEVASHVGDGDDYILMSLNGKVLKVLCLLEDFIEIVYW